MPNFDAPAARRRSLLPVLASAITFPIVFFYSYLIYSCRNIPLLDDYDAGLDFANHLVRYSTFSERLTYYVTAQHNEYKLFFGFVVVWLQLALTGHINFVVIAFLGNIAILFLGIVLWKMFLPGLDLERRLALFLPVCFILFQYQYVETLNWPMSGIQNLPILAAAIGSFYLLGRKTRGAFVGSLGLMVFGIAISGNGFLISALGMLMLLINRMYARLAAWSFTSVLCAWLYAYQYKNLKHEPLLKILTHLRFAYLLGFLGAAGRYPVRPGAIVLGFALCVFFGWMIWRGYLQKDPVVGYCLLFILLTGLAVSGLRGDLGLGQSLSSRYRMYSDLLLIFAWFALVKMNRLAEIPSLRQNRLFVSVATISVLFCIVMDGNGVRNLRKRDRDLEHGMALFERSGGLQSPVYSQDGQPQGYVGFDEHARQILIESEKAGTYEPPPY